MTENNVYSVAVILLGIYLCIVPFKFPDFFEYGKRMSFYTGIFGVKGVKKITFCLGVILLLSGVYCLLAGCS
ncbi:MAG: hypothetical protein Q3993_08605 [Filifactor alocis]|nr:hypothetical protein [Filifactor alocis]